MTKARISVNKGPKIIMGRSRPIQTTGKIPTLCTFISTRFLKESDLDHANQKIIAVI